MKSYPSVSTFSVTSFATEMYLSATMLMARATELQTIGAISVLIRVRVVVYTDYSRRRLLNIWSTPATIHYSRSRLDFSCTELDFSCTENVFSLASILSLRETLVLVIIELSSIEMSGELHTIPGVLHIIPVVLQLIIPDLFSV